jgi:hypothetical protein
MVTQIATFNQPSFYVGYFHFVAFASTAGGLRNWNAAAFASFEKYASHFSNSGKPEPNQKILC